MVVYSTGVGYAACAVAVLGFGSNLAPAKYCRTADGMFFALNMCAATWAVGLAVQLARGLHGGWGAPPFEPLAAVGGAVWATGNVMVVPVIKLYGLSLGLLVWGMTNMLMGWAAGHFGLFGVQREATLKSPVLNYAGVLLACVSLAAFSRVRSQVSARRDTARRGSVLAAGGAPAAGRLEQSARSRSWNHHQVAEYGALPANEALLPQVVEANGDGEGAGADIEAEDDPFAAIPSRLRQGLGFGIALFIGLLYGTTFDPAQHLMDHARGGEAHSQNALDYVFSHFTGIFAATLCYWLAYCVARRALGLRVETPDCAPEAMAAGVLWAVAQVSWFVANEALSIQISFPIIATLPGLVGALWGVFVFGEIRGWRNYGWLITSSLLQGVAVACIALSKG